MKRTLLFILLLLTLSCFKSIAQPAVYLFLEDLPGGCGLSKDGKTLLSFADDIEWSVAKANYKDGTGKPIAVGSELITDIVVDDIFGDGKIGVQINLNPLDSKSAFMADEEVTISVSVKSTASCAAGWSGSLSIIYDGSGTVYSDPDMSFRIGMAGVVIEPELTVPNICPGGDAGNITIANVDNFTGYSIKVQQDGADALGFTLGTLGATTTIKADASVTPGTYTVVLNDGTKDYTKDFTVQTPPTLKLEADLKDGAAGYYCLGGADNTALNLTATCGAAGYTFSWTRNGTAVAGTSNILSNVNQDGTYKVKATKDGACPTQEVSITVTEKPAPAKPSITPPAEADVCFADGGKTTLNVDAPVAGHNYTWKGGSLPTGTKATSVDINHNTVSTTGSTYTVQDNDGFCNSEVSDAVKLTAHKISVSINPAGKQVADGSALTLTATATTDPTSGTVDATSWGWTGTGAGIDAASNANSNTINTNAITTLTGTSAYTVKVKDQFGCEATKTESYSVKAGTSWDFTLADVAKCTGETISLAPTMTGSTPAQPLKSVTWSSTNGLAFANANTQNTTVTTTTPGQYDATLTIVDANNVTKTHTITVKVYGKPTITDIEVTSSKVCKGDEIDLRANGGKASTTVLDNSASLNYVWTNAKTATTTANTNKAALAAAGDNIYGVKLKDGNGCESPEVQVTYVGHEVLVDAKINNSKNTISIPWGSKANLDCEVTFNPATGTPAPDVATYQWTGAAGFTTPAANKTATTDVLKTNGDYTVTVTDIFGCSASDAVQYTIEGGELTVSASDVYVCAGSTASVTCTTGGGSGTDPLTYEWMDVNPGSGLVFDKPKDQTTTVSTTPAGTYKAKVKVTKGTQTAYSNEITITVGEQPQLTGIAVYKYDGTGTITGTVGASETLLPGTIVDVVVTASALPAGTIYNWTPTDKIDYTSADELTATSLPLAKGAPCFKLEVKNAEGKCPDTEQACLMVNGTEFSVKVAGDSICLGTTTTLTAVPEGGKKPYNSYTWNCDDPNFHYTGGDQPSITVSATTPVGVYTGTVTVTDKDNNVAVGTFKVKVKPLPAWIAIAPTSPQNVKVGNTITLTASANPVTTKLTWTGTPADPQVGTTGTASMVAGPFTIAGGAYQYSVEAELDGCRIDSVLLINVIEKTEDIVITGSDNVKVCEGEEGVITVDAKGGSGDLSYRWEVVSGDIQLTTYAGKQTSVLSGSVGSHRVRVTVSDRAATDPAPDQTKDIIVNITAKPVINSIVVNNLTKGTSNVTTVDYGDLLELVGTVTPGSATTCIWSETGSDLQSPNGSTVYTKAITATNTFTLKATSADGCPVEQSVTVTVDKPANAALLELELDRKCADSGESMILTMKAQGGTTYSFTLKNNNGLSKDFTGAGPWTYPIALGDQDTYFVQNFKAFKNGLEVTPTQVIPSQIEALFYTTPSITVVNGNVQKVCEGDELILNASSQLAGTEYKWDNDVVNGEPFFPTESGTYTVTATSKPELGGCKATATVNVTITPKPTVTITASSEDICLGDEITLTAGGDATDFVWNNEQTGATIKVTPTVGGSVKYVVTGKENVNGCSQDADVIINVSEPPVIVSTSRTERSIAIGKSVVFAVKATGKNLKYQWKRWDGGSWFTLSDDNTASPVISGTTTDSLRLSDVPKSWDGMQFQCVVTNNCGNADTTFLLHVKECFEILDIEWDMCEGIRPETDPSVEIDGWYCPGTKIGICARLVLDEDVDVDMRDAVFKWTVDGLRTDDGRWGEMVFISDSSKLSWIPPTLWQDNITVALCAYIDGACDTICKSYLRLKATPFADLDWKLKTSVDMPRMFCPGDTVTCWIDDPKKTAGLKPTYRWYNDIFDLQTEECPNNKVVSLQNDKVVLAMGQQDTWVKVVMTPSPEICTRQPEYIDTAFLKVKKTVEPQFSIWCEDTLACFNDEIHLEARWENAGENPTFEWTRSIGYPYWSLGYKSTATTILDENDVWVKCILKPSDEVCFNTDTVFADAIQIRMIKDPKVVIAADLKDKVPGDEIWVESDITGMPVLDPIFTWYINNRIDQEEEDVLVSTEFKQNDSICLGVRGERICQNQVFSNTLIINFNRSLRDTLVTIYQGERIRDMNMVKNGDDLTRVMFTVETVARYGVGSISPDGKFNYIPNTGFIGTDEVRYKLIDRITKATIAEGTIYITVRDNGRFVIPNLITPNDDGLNDTWKLDFLSEYPNHRILIFDRNGKLVFESADYQNDWDGTGQAGNGYVAHINLMNGVYTYIIDLGDKDKTILKSWVEIRANINKRNYR